MCPLFLSAITPQCHQTLLKTTLAANHSPCFRFDNGFDMSSHSFKGGRGKPKATISVSRSSKAGLQFHVGRIALFLKSGKYAKRVGRPQVSRRGGKENEIELDIERTRCIPWCPHIRIDQCVLALKLQFPLRRKRRGREALLGKLIPFLTMSMYTNSCLPSRRNLCLFRRSFGCCTGPIMVQRSAIAFIFNGQNC